MKKEKREIAIEVKNLKKDYITGKVITNVLKGISFKVYKGEFIGIMGSSGSGKSTTLHQLGLLDEPTSGSIIINGIDVSKLSDEEKTEFRLQYLGYVFQQYRNLPELNALENVFLPMMTNGVKIEECIPRAKKFLKIVGLKNKYNHLPSELSGGEQQRIAIAKALGNNPDILFADEPTANLDTASSQDILKLFKKFNKENNQTIIMVSHDTDQIKYFDRVIRVVDGKLESKK